MLINQNQKIKHTYIGKIKEVTKDTYTGKIKEDCNVEGEEKKRKHCVVVSRVSGILMGQ